MFVKRVAVKLIKSNATLHALVKQAKGRQHLVATGSASAKEKRGSLGAEFKSLYRLRNFASAAQLLDIESFSKLNLPERLIVIRCLYGAGKGLIADQCLEKALEDTEQVCYDGAQLASLAETLRISGLPNCRKDERLRRLRKQLHVRFPENRSDLAKIRLTQFLREEQLGNANENLDLLDISGYGEEFIPICAKFFPILSAYGYQAAVYEYLEKCTSVTQEIDLFLVKQLVKYMPEWFDSRQEVLKSIVDNNLEDLSLIRILHGRKSEREYYNEMFARCFKAMLSSFSNSDTYRKDGILRFLLKIDLWDEALTLSVSSDMPDSVLPKWISKGFGYLVDGDYGASLECFEHVIKEDATDKLAAGGLRFALPRAGYPIKAILDMRARFGYGAESAGRKVILKDSEYTTVEMMAGNYLSASYSKKKTLHWALLEKQLGSKFYNYRGLELNGCAGGLFIIADEGVGDEIRTAQFYGQLNGMFSSVTITCDPRLFNILSKSFPWIRFSPIKRIRKITSTRADTIHARLVGVHEGVSKYFDENTYREMQSADRVTFSQNLMFNYFSGVLGRPTAGGYLRWNCSGRVGGKGSVLRVGILWRSHLQVGLRKLMYLRVEDFAPLTKIDGVELWSIQHAMTEAEAQTCRELGINLLDDVDLFNDFEGMAGCLLGLDLLIGISSVPMELGAALGVETWMLGFSPENYYLRTAGGKTEVDQLTLNSTVIAPPWIDFTEPQEVCVREVFEEVKRRLAPKLAARADASSRVCEG